MKTPLLVSNPSFSCQPDIFPKVVIYITSGATLMSQHELNSHSAWLVSSR